MTGIFLEIIYRWELVHSTVVEIERTIQSQCKIFFQQRYWEGGYIDVEWPSPKAEVRQVIYN